MVCAVVGAAGPVVVSVPVLEGTGAPDEVEEELSTLYQFSGMLLESRLYG